MAALHNISARKNIFGGLNQAQASLQAILGNIPQASRALLRNQLLEMAYHERWDLLDGSNDSRSRREPTAAKATFWSETGARSAGVEWAAGLDFGGWRSGTGVFSRA